MRIVAAVVVKKYWYVVQNAALSIKLIMHGSDIEPADIIMVRDFAIVRMVGSKGQI